MRSKETGSSALSRYWAPTCAGQLEPAGHVVVVDVGLEDVGDPHAGRLGDAEDAVVVALRVDHQGDLAVVGQIGAVTQARGVQGENGDHGGPLGVGDQAAVSTGRPASIHAPVPPATLVASMPTARISAVAWALRPPDWQIT